MNHILHLDTTGVLITVTIKISKRQPPSIKSLNNMYSVAHINNLPCKCNRKFCEFCKNICIDPLVVLSTSHGEDIEIKAARFSCKTRYLVYIIFDETSKQALYVGHTGQAIETRFHSHMGGKKKKSGKSKIRNGFLPAGHKDRIYFKITAVHAHKYRVKRLEAERHWINALKPIWNVQVEHHWWSNKTHEHDGQVISDDEL